MEFRFVKEGGFEYIEEGQGPAILLLHGLFGALSNWYDVIKTFSKDYTVIIPLMPVYIQTKVQPDVESLSNFIWDFVQFKQLRNFSLVGNSLGGHVALLFTFSHPTFVKNLTLTGSSGLFESGMGSTFPRRGDRKFIQDRVAFTFFDPKTATDELVDEVYEIVNDNYKAMRVLKIARDAQRKNVFNQLKTISCPTLLIWGLNDNITPTYVAHEFHHNIPNSELHFIDKCGHASMMEVPKRFNYLLQNFLLKHN